MTYYVYTYFIDGVPRYVGKGVGGRWAAHRSPTKRSKLANTLRSRHRKTGEWIKPTIQNCQSEQEAFKEEVRLIAYYGRLDLGKGTLWNLTDGGEGASGSIVSEATRSKIRETFNRAEVKLKHSNATKLGMPARKPKRKSVKRGSEEFRQIVSAATKAAMKRPEVKAKMKRPKTDACKEALSRSHMKLSTEEIQQIFLAPGLHRQIAAKFGISPSHVGCIKRQEREVYRKAIGEIQCL